MQVLACSVDSIFVHKAWCDNELSKMVTTPLPFPMLADTGGALGTLYGVYDSQAKVDYRGTFIIDPDGIIQSAEILTPPVGRNVEEWLRRIEAFKHVRESGGTEATPVGWKKGESTLKPSPELVGQVCEVWKP